MVGGVADLQPAHCRSLGLSGCAGRGGPPEVRSPLFAFGCFCAALAFLLPVRQAAGARARETRTTEVAARAVQRNRKALNKGFAPVARLVADINVATNGGARREKQARLSQLAVDLAARTIGSEETRVSFFKYVPGPPESFEFQVHAGRTEEPRGNFTESSERGREVLRLARDRETRFVPDTEKEHVAGWDPTNAGYSTFICTPVVADDKIVGLLTVDDPVVGALTTDDKLEAEVFAHLLASGLGR